ncbi:MAG: 23S rRNA (adenine(2503)-C(2))-methyltransferase RlmN [Sedimentisphaerales bacterium]
MSNDLKDKTLGELEEIVVGLGQKKYLAKYIFSFLHREGVQTISEITPLSKVFRAQLVEEGYTISRLTLSSKRTDRDGTVKYVFTLEDGNRIETVLLLDDKRRTLCLSTQAGCVMGCAFCATARIGFKVNLTTGQIVDQVNLCVEGVSPLNRGQDARDTAVRISNIVYMGMGEPLANYDAVLKSLRILNDPAGKNIGIRHITVSTCGLVPAIRKLAGEELRPRLAISLNAPTDVLRTQLMPINAKYPLTELMKAVRFYQDRTRQRVTFEYVLIKELNDSTEQSKIVVRLLEGLLCNVNLIEHNPYPGCEFAGSDRERIRRFASVLERAGIETTVRFRMGRRIKAACGQLGADWLHQ